jgi:secreted Zn-dependent insulinase-like peptidase
VVIAAPKPQAKTAEPAATTLRPFARRIEAESEIRTVETRANNVIKSYFVALGMNGRVTYSYDLDDKGLPTKVKVSGVSSADIAAFTSRISAALTEAYTKGHRLQRAVLTLEKEHVGKKGPFRSHDRSVLVQ